MISKMLVLVMLAAAPSAAQAQLYISGNDTGGMILWTPESERLAVAAAGCALRRLWEARRASPASIGNMAITSASPALSRAAMS